MSDLRVLTADREAHEQLATRGGSGLNLSSCALRSTRGAEVAWSVPPGRLLFLVLLLLGCSGTVSPLATESPSSSTRADPSSEAEAEAEAVPVAPAACQPVAFELGEPTYVTQNGPNEADPVAHLSGTVSLSLRYRCGAEERVQTLPALSLSGHGAGRAATVTIRGENTRVEDPEGGLDRLGLPRTPALRSQSVSHLDNGGIARRC